MNNDFILAFDTLYTTNHIQILKASLSLMPEKNQPIIAAIIKYMEFNYTLKLAKAMPAFTGCLSPMDSSDELKAQSFLSSERLADYSIFFQSILPFCDEKEAELVKQLLSMKNAFDTYEQMKPILSLLGQMDQEALQNIDLLKSVLSPKQQEIFHIFNEEMNHGMDE